MKPSQRIQEQTRRLIRGGNYYRCCLGLILGIVGVAFDANGAISSAALDESIRNHRMGVLIVEAAPNTPVRVEQVRHEFEFGAALANQAFNGRLESAETATYRRMFLENFNSAVTENALKWHDMEPQPGRVNYKVVDAMLAWTDEHNIPLWGHNIFWGIPNRVQPWLKEMDDATLRATLRARALDVGRRYRGRFAEYDLNNDRSRST